MPYFCIKSGKNNKTIAGNVDSAILLDFLLGQSCEVSVTTLLSCDVHNITGSAWYLCVFPCTSEVSKITGIRGPKAKMTLKHFETVPFILSTQLSNFNILWRNWHNIRQVPHLTCSYFLLEVSLAQLQWILAYKQECLETWPKCIAENAEPHGQSIQKLSCV